MNQAITLIKNITGFGEGNYRLNIAKKNIIATLIIKGLNISIGFILIPLIIDYLDPTRYGIWITLSSIIAWFSFFDIGLGNGLRNRLAEAFAKNDRYLARIYVSTTYAILSLIIIGVLILFFIINPLLNWNSILNAGTETIDPDELSLLVYFVFSLFSLQFVFKLINMIFMADQMPARVSLIDFFTKLLSLIFIFILMKTTEGSLIFLGIIIGISPIIILSISSIWFFNRKFSYLRPAWKFVKFNKARDLFSLGAKFFIIQIAAILLYQTNTIIISQLFGPAQVTPYSIAFQYFSILMMIFSIAVAPFWSAFTEAWVKNEILWIKNIMKKLYKIWLILIVFAVLMLVLSKNVYDIWVGSEVSISYTMSALIGIWMLMNTWNSIFSQFLNGVGKLKIQLYLGISSALINIPLAIFLGMKIGVLGVFLSNIIVSLAGTVIYPFQYKKIINNNAKGIWNE